MAFSVINSNIMFQSIKSAMKPCAVLSRAPQRNVTYVQGQTYDTNIREYFYFIDHQGMLFLDDSRMKNFTSCFKETKFLQFFFKRIRLNETNRYLPDFPYLSLCGRERNYIRCDDVPIVFTHVIEKDSGDIFSYAHAGELLTHSFTPQHICMLPETGRVYHPAMEIVGGAGLVRSKLAIEFSKFFEFENGDQEPPTHFTWKSKRYELTNELVSKLRQRPQPVFKE